MTGVIDETTVEAIVGPVPGDAMDEELVRQRSERVRAARLGTLHELPKLAPVAVIAEALGYSPATTSLKGGLRYRAQPGSCPLLDTVTAE